MKKLNLTTLKCPETYLYTKLALEKLDTGDTLQVFFSNEKSAQNVSSSVENENHKVLKMERSTIDENETWELLIERC